MPPRDLFGGGEPRTRQLIATLLATGFLTLTSCERRPNDRPNRIVVVTLDTLRHDAFAGGPDRPTAMPLTRARARDCAVFERSYSSTSSTQPTHASLFTGLHPWQHGVTENGQVLAEDQVLVSERLREYGYKTAAVVASFPVSSRFGFAQGFDEYHDEFTYILRPWAKDGPPDDKFYSLADTITEKAIDVLNRFQEVERQYFWFHYFDPHGPYGDTKNGEATVRPRKVLETVVETGADREEAIANARALYDTDCAFLDASLDRLFARLDADEEHIDTHILAVADHGESFGEDGSMAHGRRLTPGQIHVPFFLCSPRVPPGMRHDVTGSIDATSTILALADLPDDQGEVPGRDLTRGPSPTGRAFGMRRTFDPPIEELRFDGRHHLLDFNLFFVVDRDGTLYRGNAQKLLDRPAQEVEGAELLTNRLRVLFESFEAELQGQSVVALTDEEPRRALEALGYVQ